MTRSNAPTRFAILAYGLLAYVSFHAVFLYLIVFLADGPLPYTVESGPHRPLALALGIDVALVALFALQHTVMARPRFKRAFTRIVPAPMERSTFVLATVACLAVMMRWWSPIDGYVFQAEASWLRAALWAVQGVGWVLLVWSTFLIDHWELFGVRQVIAHFRGQEVPHKSFRAPSLYRIVRHPMMVGLLLGLWATPDLSWSRVVFAAACTAYVLVGVRIEERDLETALGERYRDYQRRVPRLLPRPGVHYDPASETPDASAGAHAG